MEKKSVLLVWWWKIVNHFCKSEVEKRIEETEMPSKTKKLTESVECFLKSRYDFRYNILTEETEFRSMEQVEEGFLPINQRVLRSIILSDSIWMNCLRGMA